jgi:hypothetical protein
LLRHLPLVLIVVWAVLLMAFMGLRPAPRSFLFWLMIGSATAVGGAYMVLSRRESAEMERGVSAWNRRIRQLVDVHDFDDDGHLAEYLDEPERRVVIELLVQMPPGSRSLRTAIAAVAPELLKDNPS